MALNCKNCGGKLQFLKDGNKIHCEFCGFSGNLLDEAYLLDNPNITSSESVIYRRALQIIKNADCKNDWQTALELLRRVNSDLYKSEIADICEENLRIYTEKENFDKLCKLKISNDIYSLKLAIKLLEENPQWENQRKQIDELTKRIEEIIAKNEAEEKRENRAKKTKQIFKKFFSVSIALLIIIGVFLLISYNSRKHDIKRIKAEIINISSEYHPNESPYINGCYYIYFDFLIKNNTYTEIDSITLTTEFKNSSGVSVYRMTSDFGGFGTAELNLRSNEEARYQTYLKDGAVNTDISFLEIYEADLSDYEIIVTVSKVTFNDGHNY